MQLSPRFKILSEIDAEATRACELHGPMHSLHEAYGVIKEEFEEWWEEVKKNPKKLSTLEAANRRQALKEEMIQMAAMCVKTIESLNL